MKLSSRVASVLVVLLLTASLAQAQYQSEGKHRHWYTDWKWWVGEAAIAGLRAADGHSTARARSRCTGCVETNPFLGKHPQNGGIIAISSVGFAIETGLHIASWKNCPSESRAWQIACASLAPGIDAAISLRGIVHNYSLGSRPKSVLPSSSSLTRFGQTQFLRPMQTERDGWIMLANGGTEKPLFLPKQYFRTINRNPSLYAD